MKKILLLPFEVNAPTDMTYIKNGIADILTSRLASDQLQILTATQIREEMAQSAVPATDAAALDLARRISADYVILGSLTILGQASSTDARCLDAGTGRTVVTFSQFGRQLGEVVDQLNSFANRIHQSLSGSPLPPAAAPSAAIPIPTGTPEYRQNPENLLQELKQPAE